jgi:hypothetical protein
MTKDGCGAKRSELLRISSQASLWLRIPSAFSTMIQAARSEDSFGRLPRSGMYANGTLSQLPTLELCTLGKGSGLWPTPTVFHAQRGNHDEPVGAYLQRVQDHKDGKTKGKPGPSLGIAVRMWPTPTAQDASNDGGPSQQRRHTVPLNAAVKIADSVRGEHGRGRLLPTPNTVDAKGGTRKGKGQEQLCHLVGGSLNPTWVEWLMGYPAGWTDLGASETQ